MYEIPKGRKDGRRSRIEDTINLPSFTLNASGLINIFGKRGFIVEELVALSGKYIYIYIYVTSFLNFIYNSLFLKAKIIGMNYLARGVNMSQLIIKFLVPLLKIID
jgi:hypothetical protein